MPRLTGEHGFPRSKVPTSNDLRKAGARAAIFADRRPGRELAGLLPLMSRAAACASGWPACPTRGRRWAGGIRWSTCWRWRSVRSPRTGTTRQPRSLSGRPAARRTRWPSSAGGVTRGPGGSARPVSVLSPGSSATSMPRRSTRLYGYLTAMPASPPGALPAVTRHEREQRRAAAAAARPDPPGLLGQAAADGKTVRGAVRADGSQVHLLSVLDVATGCVRAQREIDAKTNEIPELAGDRAPGPDRCRRDLGRPAHPGRNRPPPGRGQARALPDDHQRQPALSAAGRCEGPGQL